MAKNTTVFNYGTGVATEEVLGMEGPEKLTTEEKLQRYDLPESESSYEKVMAEVSSKAGECPPRPSDLPEGNWTEQSLKVLQERYLKKDEEGVVVESADEMIWRVAFSIASAEVRWGKTRREVVEKAKDFYNLMISRKFLPNSPTLMNAGKGNGLQYSACFVLPVEDSIEGIFDGIKYQALIHKSGGGTGFSFSRLRPRGARVNTSRGVASGPVSFMKVYNEATQQIKQGGTRRGANMGILRIDHPDVREFITCKLDGGITNFNISVAVTDVFIKALENGGKYDLIEPHSGEVVGEEDALDIFNLICDCAWKSGDPGMIFIDKVNSGPANPVREFGPVESTNPCGEQPLYPYDACNLGSLFLDKFVGEIDGKYDLDWTSLAEAVAQAVRFLDDVIEVNPYPLEQIWKTVRLIRRIGLGVGGFADMLYLMGVSYDSDEALSLAKKIALFINDEGHRTSEKLAQERGAFPLWNKSIYKDGLPLRNSTVTTIAPTGTIGIIAGSSGGIEPVFALAYKHMVKDESLNREMYFVDAAFEAIAKREGFWNQELAEKVVDTGGVEGVDNIPDQWRRVFVTSHDIKPEWHVKMQAAWQEHVDNAVSKTINLPNDATVDDVKEAYLSSYKFGCKGITIYRDGSKDWQVLNVGKKDDKKKEEKKSEEAEEVASLRVRPKQLTGKTYEVATPVGNAFITINSDEEGRPFEVFTNVGKAGSHLMADAEALGRLVSLSLRIPSKLAPRAIAEAIVDQLAGIGGADSIGFGNGRVRSLADGVAKTIRAHLEGQGEQKELTNGHAKESPLLEENKHTGSEPVAYVHQEALPLTSKKRDLCPDCGQATLVMEEGCMKCYSCGASKC